MERELLALAPLIPSPPTLHLPAAKGRDNGEHKNKFTPLRQAQAQAPLAASISRESSPTPAPLPFPGPYSARESEPLVLRNVSGEQRNVVLCLKGLPAAVIISEPKEMLPPTNAGLYQGDALPAGTQSVRSLRKTWPLLSRLRRWLREAENWRAAPWTTGAHRVFTRGSGT